MEKRKHQESKKLKRKNKEHALIKLEPEEKLHPAFNTGIAQSSPKSSKHKNSKPKTNSQQEYLKEEEVDDFPSLQLVTTPRKKKSKDHSKPSPSVTKIEPQNQQNSSNEELETGSKKIVIGTPRKGKSKGVNKSSPPVAKIEASSDENLDDEPEELTLVVTRKGKPKGLIKSSSPIPKSEPKAQRQSSEEELEDEEHQTVNELDIRSIPKEDLQILFDNIQQCIPKQDAMRPQSRCKRIDWTKVAFGEYSAEKCSEMWRLVEKCLRHYRTLGELIDDAKLWAEKPSLAYSKVSDHPEYPKRPKSAFTEFLMHAKDEIMRQNRGLRVSQLTRLASQKFKSLSDSKRSIYTNKAQKNIRQFEDQLRSFYIKHPELKSEETSKLIGPKRPLTPFSHFVEFQIEQEQLVADKTVVRKASKPVWEKLKPSKKLKWIRMASEEQKSYLEEVNKYNQEHPDEAIKPVKNVLNKLEMQILDNADGKPIKPPSSAYMVYLQQILKKHADEFTSLSFSDKIKTVAAKWKLLSKDEKDHFVGRQQKLQEKYDTEYAAYLESLPEIERQKLEDQIAGSAKKRRIKKQNDADKLSPKRLKGASLKHNLTFDAVPSHWDTMSEEDRKVYAAAVARLRDYFEARSHDTSLQEAPVKDESSSESEEETEDSSSSTSSSESDSD